jgi:hypothetical protein
MQVWYYLGKSALADSNPTLLLCPLLSATASVSEFVVCTTAYFYPKIALSNFNVRA